MAGHGSLKFGREIHTWNEPLSPVLEDNLQPLTELYK